jgi:hypothetical protein
MERPYHFLCRMMRKFLFKRELNYNVYVINGVTWYRLEPKSPKFRFPKAVNMIMINEDPIRFPENVMMIAVAGLDLQKKD